MKENVEHHMEEEEGDMFKKARQVFDKAELEHSASGWSGARPKPQQELKVPAGR